MRFEQILSDFGEKYRERVAVITPSRSVTFGDLAEPRSWLRRSA